MPREPRIYIENVLYFVTARVNNDRVLFHDDADYAEYLKPLSEYKLLNGFKLYAYALMPKQICLLIELRNNVKISTIMHNLNSRYTKVYNSRYGKKGHLFQGRFKSILVEKEEYLLRLTRYIHMLPKQTGACQDFKDYPYSSCRNYFSASAGPLNILERPDIEEETKEVCRHLSGQGTDEEIRNAYGGYVGATDSGEMKSLMKILHRTAFVGSKKFIAEMKARVEDHVKQEEKARVVRKSNPVFVLTGSMIILFLATVSYNFYHNQSDLQETLSKTSSGFSAASDQLTTRVKLLENELTKLEDTDELDGTVWEIRITPMNESETDQVTTGKVYFKNGQVTIRKLTGQIFPAFNYTLTTEDNGRTIWKTAQGRMNGTQIQIEGMWTGKKVKGLVRERPDQGLNKDFTFVSVRRVRDARRGENALQ